MADHDHTLPASVVNSRHRPAYFPSTMPTDRDIVRFWAKVQKTEDCWLWIGGQTHGYGIFSFGGRKGRPLAAHRFSHWIASGVFPGELDVLHECDTPLCVRPDHLFLGTQADNNEDSRRKGRRPRGENHPFFGRECGGEKHPSSLFREDQIRSIRARYAAREATPTELAREHNVHRQTIWHIINRTTWRCVPD
jgi:hypothetical protein